MRVKTARFVTPGGYLRLKCWIPYAERILATNRAVSTRLICTPKPKSRGDTGGTPGLVGEAALGQGLGLILNQQQIRNDGIGYQQTLGSQLPAVVGELGQTLVLMHE